MIPASDLRIKNYVLNHHRQLCFVKKISDDDVVEVTKAGTHETYFCMSEALSPIPLGGWLDNLGFEQNKFHKVLRAQRKDGTRLSFKYVNDGIVINGAGFLLFVKVDYVHQFQNLFFAIVGEEAKVTLFTR